MIMTDAPGNVARAITGRNDLGELAMASILYPAALALDGQIVFIGAAVAGLRYDCLHCGQRMVARKGEIKEYHFAHYRAGDCEPDAALHTYAQRLIRDGHAAAGEYRAEFQCQGCGEWIGKSVKGYDCSQEVYLVKDARSDIAFVNGAHRRLVVEIVVTHEMEGSAVSAYQSDNIPVMIIRPTWETVEDLYRRVRADDVLNIEPFCKPCKNARQAEQARREKIERFAQSALQTQLQAVRAMRYINETGLPFARWHTDRSGNPMYERTQNNVFASAQRLANKGWKQRNARKPWVFSYDLPFSTAFADFGGNEFFPIYRYTAAQVYVFSGNKLQNLPDDKLYDFERHTTEEVMRALKSFGVPIANI